MEPDAGISSGSFAAKRCWLLLIFGVTYVVYHRLSTLFRCEKTDERIAPIEDLPWCKCTSSRMLHRNVPAHRLTPEFRTRDLTPHRMDISDQTALLPPLQPINVSVSLRDQAYAALKQMITEADIYAHPEEIRLDERQLSLALGVSRTPIREAMTLLEQEGFLRTVPRRGIFIVRKTKKQIIEMIEMWAAIESMAARLATVNASDEDIAGLRRMFDEFRNATPAAHIEEYSGANIAFHQAIIRLSGSHLMGKTIDNLFIHVRAIRRMTIAQSDRAERSIIDHMRIIEALERRDTELAERLVRQHSLDLAAHVDKYCDFLD